MQFIDYLKLMIARHAYCVLFYVVLSCVVVFCFSFLSLLVGVALSNSNIFQRVGVAKV